MLARIQEDQPDLITCGLQMTGFGCFWGDWLRYQLYCGKGKDADVQAGG